ncbi:MAG: hypothetical protein F6K10_25425 [Moorea sp. SIO2B7]|nr:hypothetical protein [Moorena sp. SIO2B7]
MKPIKSLKILIGTLLFTSLCAVLANPVKAHTNNKQIQNQASEHTTDGNNYLISQHQGHNKYKGELQLKFRDYEIGRVVGNAGGILSVVLEEGTSFNSSGDGYPGGDVLVIEDDGMYTIVGTAEPPWLMELEEDYGVRRIDF